MKCRENGFLKLLFKQLIIHINGVVTIKKLCFLIVI